MPAITYLYTEAFLDRRKNKIYEDRFGFGDSATCFLKIKFRGRQIIKSVRGQETNIDWNDDPRSDVGRILAEVKRLDEGVGVKIMCQNETEIDKLLEGDIKKVYNTKPLFADDPDFEPSDEDDSVSKIGDEITF